MIYFTPKLSTLKQWRHLLLDILFHLFKLYLQLTDLFNILYWNDCKYSSLESLYTNLYSELQFTNSRKGNQPTQISIEVGVFVLPFTMSQYTFLLVTFVIGVIHLFINRPKHGVP